MEILYYADLIPVDIVLAIQAVTSVRRDRKTSRKLCRRFGERGKNGQFARFQIEELQDRRHLQRVYKVNATVAQCPKPMAVHRKRFGDQLIPLVGQASIGQPGREQHTPDSGGRYTAVVEITPIL